MTRRLPSVTDSQQGLDPALAQTLDQQFGLLAGAGDAALLARVKDRVMQAVARDAAPAYHTVRVAGSGWETIAPGVERKMLWLAGTAASCMIRMAPGSVVEGHLHPMDEECVVLEGSVRIGDTVVLHAGDFHVGRGGSTHQATCTDTGALVYLRGAA